MIILNVNYELVHSVDETTHQLELKGIQGVREPVTVHGFSLDEVSKYFCDTKGTRVIKKGMLSVNTDTWTFHIDKEEDENIYIIFNEYLHVSFKEKQESRISLKNPIKIIEASGNINSYQDVLKYFTIPKSNHPFWIKEYQGKLGSELTCFYWDGNEFKNIGNVDMEELEASPDKVKNIITVRSEKNLFLTDHTVSIGLFLKTYPDMYFRFLYEDFLDGIEKKYEDYDRVIITDMNLDDYDVEEELKEKAKGKTPFYIVIPTEEYGVYYAVYEAIKIKE